MSTLRITKSYRIHHQTFSNILLYDRNRIKYTAIVEELFNIADNNLELPMEELKLKLIEAKKASKAKSRCYLYTDNNRIECSTKGGFPQWYVMRLEDYINLP